MMSVFRMPSLGADMEAGTLVEWLKKPGDKLKPGDVIAVVETQKGAIEIEVFDEGTLQKTLIGTGSTVPVGAELAIISNENEQNIAAPAKISAPPKSIVAPAATVEKTAHPPRGERPISPAARHFAAEHGLNLADIQGTGPEGAIVFVDVEAAWSKRQSITAAPAAPAEAPHRDSTSAMRSAIAAAMTRSKREIPHYYLGQTVDVSGAITRLEAHNATHPTENRIVFAVLLLKAVAAALRTYPEFNGHYGPSGFSPIDRINIGMAIAQRAGGLVAPAIHDVDTLESGQLMIKLRDIVGRVHAGRLRASELSDPTFTVTSLGDRGTDWLLPVIYPPQVAILGAGSPTKRPWVVNEQIAIRSICQLTLAADHRVSDGHRGALLLRDVAQRLESMELS